jgi:hypothetical protein
MLLILDSAAGLGAASHEQRRFSPRAWPPLGVLRAMCEALHEGLAVHRDYEVLRSKGLPHDAALRQALAIGPAPSWQAWGTVAPLYFAGRA